MSEYKSIHGLITEGRLSELMDSLLADESVIGHVPCPCGIDTAEIRMARTGVTVVSFTNAHAEDAGSPGGALTVRTFPSTAHAMAYMAMAQATLSGSPLDMAMESSDFMVI